MPPDARTHPGEPGARLDGAIRSRALTVVRRPFAFAAVLVALTVALAAADQPLPGADWLLHHVKILSAPDMEGRASGTPGADRAAAHISRVFKEAGLAPAGDAGGFLQTFSVPTGIRLSSPTTLTQVRPTPRAFTPGTDFTPLAISTDGHADGELVFVGHGITAPDLGYDDYAGLDARGKIVLAMMGEPRAQDPASPFRRPEAYHYSDRSHKVINAREHGARAILLVPPPRSTSDALPPLSGTSQPLGILAAAITRVTAEVLLAPSGRRLVDLADAIDRALAPQSRAVPGTSVRLEITLQRDRGSTANVVGIVSGTDPRLNDEAIVVGAHYDHLGRGGEGSLAPERIGVVHHGADDNASGTAVVMALARAFAATGGTARTLVFAAFAAEEMGLLGSTHYARHPPVPLEKTVLMVNLDMVGRLRDGKLYVTGVDSGSGLRDVVARATDGLGLAPDLRADPYAPSDHTTFYAAGRPVLFLFTGAHGDYHRPSDTWEKINAPGLSLVATVAARIVAAVSAAPTPPAYVKFQAPVSARRGGYGAFFGIVPGFGEATRPGVKVTGVRSQSPAEKAGLQAGDVIVKFAGMEVRTLEDLTFALRGRRAGDRVDVVIVRDGHERQTQATLEERP